MEFAYSFDVTWGTDHPYSGVFWTDDDNTDWDSIYIITFGTCRMVDIDIYMGDERVVHEDDCDAHSEWTP